MEKNGTRISVGNSISRKNSKSCSSVRSDSVVGITGTRIEIGSPKDILGQQRDVRRAVQDDAVVIRAEFIEQPAELLARLAHAIQNDVEISIGEIGRQDIQPVDSRTRECSPSNPHR